MYGPGGFLGGNAIGDHFAFEIFSWLPLDYSRGLPDIGTDDAFVVIFDRAGRLERFRRPRSGPYAKPDG